MACRIGPAQLAFERVEPAGPQGALRLDPARGLVERPRIDGQQVLPPGAATPHQMEVLKPGAGPTSPAAGAATQGAPGGGAMPTTPHQQDVLKPKGGG